MLMNISKKLELVANLAIIVVAFLLGAVLVKDHFVTKRIEVSRNESTATKSPALSGLNIDWRQSKQTVLLAVSSTCHFCTESAPFYKQLAKARGKTRLIAVLPQPVEEGRRYLEGLGIAVDEIRQAPLSSINVEGTPTLMLVSSDGLVVQTWIGKLVEEEQAEVLNKLL